MAASMKSLLSTSGLRFSVLRTHLTKSRSQLLLKQHVGATCQRCLSTTASEVSSEKSSLADAFRQATEASTKQSVASSSASSRRSLFRTAENDPVNHSHAHEGLYYTVEGDDYSTYMRQGQHPKLKKIVESFNECCIMVRKPALELFECLKASNLSLPVVRYLVYGRAGSGKSVTLSHVMQHCGRQGWLIVHIPWVERFVTFPRDVQASPYRPDRGDTPVDAAEWLMYFYNMNRTIVDKMTTRFNYKWSKREIMEPGIPLAELIEFAQARSKFAGDVMAAVLKEIKAQSSEGGLKTLVAVDGANSLWQKTSVRRAEDASKKYLPEEMSFVVNLRKLLRNDWTGGAVVMTIDPNCAPEDKRQESYLPRFLLSKEAIDAVEPHIPIHVQNFSDKEAASCLEYFIDRHWIQKPEGLTAEGQNEILFLSSRNPMEMYRVCSRW